MERINTLETLQMLFDNDSNKNIAYKKLALEQWGDWTLSAIYNYYIVSEQNNKRLEIKEEKGNNTKNILKIKEGDFDF